MAELTKWSKRISSRFLRRGQDAPAARHNGAPLRSELFSVEQLKIHARTLAGWHRVAPERGADLLLPRLNENEQILQRTYALVSAAVGKGRKVSPASEWLIDNFYLIQEQIRTTRLHLPRRYSRELPRLSAGPGQGYPRVYHMALELIAHLDGRIDEQTLASFVESYQLSTPLKIGELWAVPIMLRLALIENLRRVAERIAAGRTDNDLADMWADRLIEAAENRPAKLIVVLADMAQSDPELTHGFVAEISRRLQGKNPALAIAISWIEQRLLEQSQTLEECTQLETQHQAANQVSIGNSVGSIRVLSAIDWREFVEQMSATEEILRRDPAGVYPAMDFATRDRYRHVVEKTARYSGKGEEEISRLAISEAQRFGEAGREEPRKEHVGYFLIDAGREEFERAAGARMPLADRLRTAVTRIPLWLYTGMAVILTGGIAAGVIEWTWARRERAWALWLLGAVIVICASQLALSVVNSLITWFIPPRALPRMDFSKGIPAGCRTMVVVPTLISSDESARHLVEDLEVKYLANHDRHLHFALLTDFPDAAQETMPTDAARLEAVKAGIEGLNEKYQHERGDIFYLFHRPRLWNERERKWMGYERKRGKLEEFNALLRGGPAERFSVIVGQRGILPSVRFVITLDTDTELPRDAARQLVATIAHPLVRPVVDAKTGMVRAGYGILQPRVAISLPSASRSWFARLFAGEPGLDPYTRAVSDVYQDLFGEGSYIGKGIYDVDAFFRAVHCRFPENRILSHDLIEGCHARAGLVSDVQLYEDHPTHYTVDARRRHRWIRGDWQIATWLLPRVPGPDARRISNPISGLSRWKIFDNLRRSLVPGAMVGFLLLGWAGVARSWGATAVVVVFLLAPLGLSLVSGFWNRPTDGNFWQGVRHGWPGFLRQLAQAGFTLVFLPFDAVVSLDAIARTLFRMAFTRRGLLEWETARESQRRARGDVGGFFSAMAAEPALAAGICTALALTRPGVLWAAGPVLVLWLISPGLAWWLSRPLAEKGIRLDEAHQELLRCTARKTWRFFEEFVAREDHFLPPDNFQEFPHPMIAHRTSPTNIGCALLSTLAAHDFGYLATGTLLWRIEETFSTLDKMERYHAHFYNWYDTRTLRPLLPLYVSSVDSGNLMGMLLTLRQGLIELADGSLLGPRPFGGLVDSLMVLREECRRKEAGRPWPTQGVSSRVEGLIAELGHAPGTISAAELLLRRLADDAGQMRRGLAEDSPPGAIWAAEAFGRQCGELLDDLRELAPWLRVTHSSGQNWRPEQDQTAKELFRLTEALRTLELEASLRKIAEIPRTILPLLDGIAEADAKGEGQQEWLAELRQALAESAKHAAARLERIESLGERAFALSQMDFAFLFDPSRDQMAIGFNVSERRRDGSFYDLLASEARLASFVGIATEQLPQEHWFALGRRLTMAGGRPVLLSWSGSMFEYLMPLLVMPTYDQTLLDQTYRSVVRRQIAYGRSRGVPWGISESGYNATDAQLNYQYKAFGVPGLGYKRGLSDDLVIAPYATVMAMMISPKEASENLQRLKAEGVMGDYGFYEAVDYTPARIPAGQTRALVRSFMAHHEGMSLLSLAYAMLDKPMQRRFLADPLLRANTLLLHERVPRTAPVYPQSTELEEPQQRAGATGAAVRSFISPNTRVPEVHLLSNGRFHVMISNAGSGWTRWNDISLTRWRADPTRDCWGSYCYLRDLDTGKYWSAAHHPTLKKADRYEVHFVQGRAEFRRTDEDIDTRMDISVSPEADVEMRRIVVTNRSNRRRRIEITSYAEVVLSPAAADAAHRAFSNLFVQTEIVRDREAILCTRRPRSVSERPPFMVHLMTVQGKAAGEATYETDRAQFIGRGRNLAAPAAMEGGGALSGSAGAVLDPIVAIRRVIVLEADESAHVDLVTGISETRQGAMALAEKYRDPRMGDRVFEMAWTHSQVVLGLLNASEADAQIFGRLESAIVHPNRLRRADAAILARNRRGQSGLWGYGVSGDLPIVLVRISDPERTDLVRQMVQAHAYWRMKGLAVDLVIWNEDQGGYRQGVQDRIMGIIAAGPEAHNLDRPGGVFVRRTEQMPEEDRGLFLTAAQAVISDAAGTLAEQLGHRPRPGPQVPLLQITRRRPALALPGGGAARAKADAQNLRFFNGFGGVTPDGKEYIIRSDHAHFTPAPWCNVIANGRIGSVISESGSGYTFVDNAHEYRLTPWMNDAVSDPAGEAFYIRDEESGEFWSPTPLPAKVGGGTSAYTSRHGFGYSIFECVHDGIRSELTIFVAAEAPVKFAILKLRNESGQARRVSASGYWEWTLGDLRDKTIMHIVTEVDQETRALFARNAYVPDFGGYVAFADVAEPYRTFTGDREEFLGRNGSTTDPAAMRRARLSGKVGAGLDPCAAIQVPLELAVGQEEEVVFIVGAGRSQREAQELVRRFRGSQQAHRELQATWDFWNHTLAGIHVETPDAATNIMANGWLAYQTLASRMWGRSGFYQSGGAYGFRDQLQDAMGVMQLVPQVLREHLLRAAGRQFAEGDVQHWWHPPTGRGVRTRFSDDYLWLPLAAARYVKATGDTGVLEERIGYLEGRALKPEEESYYDLPRQSDQHGTLYDHCVKAIEYGLKFGVHGLPLIGCGDWNDGLNLVGAQGKGESVWLAFFLYDVLGQFVPLAQRRGDAAFAQKCTQEAAKLRENIEAHAWDGGWYRRAYFDDGRPLGSAINQECQIDSLPQSWAIISGAGDAGRSKQGMDAVNGRLINRKAGVIQLFDPPFDHSDLNPGYIKGYVPGVRENGGQYTHAAIWVIMAYALMGDYERAWELLPMVNPLARGASARQIGIYKVEPYVVAADVYACEPHAGRGGWTWYTGSAGWMYRVLMETLLGVEIEIDRLKITPRVPAGWTEYTVHYRFRGTPYHIICRRNPECAGQHSIDGGERQKGEMQLVDDHGDHRIEFWF